MALEEHFPAGASWWIMKAPGNVQKQRAGPLHLYPGAQRSSSGSDQLKVDLLGALQPDTAVAAVWEEPLGAKCVLLK